MVRKNNDSLFLGDNTNYDFVEESMSSDMDMAFLAEDPYTWEVKTKTEKVLEIKEKWEKFKKILIELNWEEVEVEYKLDTSCLLDFNHATKNAKKYWAKLVNEEEFKAILAKIWIEEFNREFPGVMYSDKNKTIGSEWKMVYFWINEYSIWWNMKVYIFSDIDQYGIYSNIWKQYWACSLLIRKSNC